MVAEEVQEEEIEQPEQPEVVKISKYQIGLQTLKDAAGGAAAEFTKSVLSSATISAATGGALALPAAGLVLLNTARGAAVGASKGFTTSTYAATQEMLKKQRELQSAMENIDENDGEEEEWDAHKAAQFIMTCPTLYSSYGGICMYEGFTNHNDCFISDWPDEAADADVDPRWDYQCVIEFPNGSAAASFLEDPRTVVLHDSFTNGYMVLAMHSKQWSFTIFCHVIYHCLSSRLCYLGLCNLTLCSARCIGTCEP